MSPAKRLFPDETIERFDTKGKLPACQGSLGAQAARAQTVQIFRDQVFRSVDDPQVLRPAAFHCGLSVSAPAFESRGASPPCPLRRPKSESATTLPPDRNWPCRSHPRSGTAWLAATSHRKSRAWPASPCASHAAASRGASRCSITSTTAAASYPSSLLSRYMSEP